MGSLNKVQLIGHLGRDAEMRYTQGGTAVATFNMATTETWKDRDGQKQERTEWHRCVLWGKAAESLQEYLAKGKQVYVEGGLQTRKWKDKDGHDRYTTEVKVRDVVLLGSASGGSSREGARRGRGEHVRDEDVAAGGGEVAELADDALDAGEVPVDDIPF